MPEHHAVRVPGPPANAAPGAAPIPAFRRLLVVMPSWVGDCVMATPLLRAIRRRGPGPGDGPRITAYLRSHLLPLFESGDLVDECIGGRPRGFLGPLREARRLGAGRFDTTLVLPNSFRAAWMTWLARIPRRIGYDRDQRGWLLSDRVPCPMPGGWHEPMPLVRYYLELAGPFGIEPPADVSPRLEVIPREIDLARGLLATQGLAPTRPIALLNPGASKPGKRWPAERFAALADRLYDSQGMQVVINGAPDERGLTGGVAERIQRAPTLDLARHDTTLATLAAMCGLVDLVVTNDTGTRHIAAAVGFERLRNNERAPGIVTLFGTVRPEWTTLNYAKERELIDRDGGRVDAISLDEVFEACRDSIASTRNGNMQSSLTE